jgi:hypothetical protein
VVEPDPDLSDLCDLSFVAGTPPLHDMALVVAMAWAGTRPGFLFVCTRPMLEECMGSGVFVAPEEVREETKMIGRGAVR